MRSRSDRTALLKRDAAGWETEASSGGPVEGREVPEQRIPLGDRHELVLQGKSVGRHDQRILDAFVAEVTAAIDVEELSAEARTVSSLVAARDARAALLASTGRGLEETAERLRRAAADTGERAGVSADVRRSAERLALLGGDLIDLGRIESGELGVRTDDVALAEVVATATGDTCIEPGRVEIDVPSTLPSVSVDPSLLRRALVEALAEAIDASPPDAPVRLVAGAVWPGVDIRIIDRRRNGRGGETAAGAGAFVAQALRVGDARPRRDRRDARGRHDARDAASVGRSRWSRSRLARVAPGVESRRHSRIQARRRLLRR